MVNLPLHFLSYNGNVYDCTDYMVYIRTSLCLQLQYHAAVLGDRLQ